MKAIGYVRVSTDKQAEPRLRPRKPRFALWPPVQGADLLEVIVDGGDRAAPAGFNVPPPISVNSFKRAGTDLTGDGQ